MLSDVIGPLSNQWLVLVIRLVLASVFLMAAVTKLPEGRRFVATVHRYDILPDPLATVYARSLPPLEMMTALALFGGIYTWAAAPLASALLSSFIAAESIAMRRGLNLECSCFGLLYREQVGRAALIRDGVLLAFSLAVVLLDEGRFALSQVVTNLPAIADVAALLLTGVLFSSSLFVAIQYARRSQVYGMASKPVRAQPHQVDVVNI